MFVSKKNSGFSLVELLVSLALMLILVGAAVIIFLNSSNVLTSSEQRIAIFQNARAALSLISRDISNATTKDGGLNFFLRNPTINSSAPQSLLEFTSVTSWIDSNATTNDISTGKARSYYYVNKANNKWSLKRHLVDSKATAAPADVSVSDANTLTNDVVCQFIDEINNGGARVPAITINYFFYDAGNNLTVRTPQQIEFDESSEETNLPVAIRITMDITDTKTKAVRTVSQMVWLVNSDNN